jgi:hypothetical protein
MEKFYFATETCLVIPQTLSVSKGYGRGYSNVATATGYAAAGFDNNGALSAIQKINLVTNTQVSASATTVTAGRSRSGHGSNNGVAGYLMGGSSGGYISASEKFSFTSETSASSTAISLARSHIGSMNNNAVALYVGGGETYNSTTYTTPYSNVDKLSYSNDSRSTFYTAQARTDMMGFSNSGTAGYLAGGMWQYSSLQMNGTGNYYKMPYSTDSFTETTSNQWYNGMYSNTCSRAGVAAYSLGSADYTSNKKIAFPSDTLTTLASTISGTRSGSTMLTMSIGN